MCYIRQNSNIFYCAPEFRMNRIADIPPAIAATSLSTLCLFEIAKAAKAMIKAAVRSRVAFILDA